METTDNRGLGTLIRQYREIESIKNRLIRHGLLNADASPDDVERALRKILPPDAFGKSRPEPPQAPRR